MTPPGYSWFVYAYFPCNASGVRVGIRASQGAAERFARAFSKRNRVETMWKMGRS